MIVRPARPMQASIALILALLLIGCTEKLVEPPPPTVLAVPDSIQEVFNQNCAFERHPRGGQPAVDVAKSGNRVHFRALPFRDLTSCCWRAQDGAP